jgi:gliding motility-associated-like protein
MKLKIFTTISYKNKTYIITLFLICGVLLNSYAGFSYSNIRTFFLNPIATISSSSEEICKYETTIITFEGSDGTEPYTFTYNINNGTPIEITTTSGSSVDITLEGTSAGDFTYNLTNVKDSNENSQVITDQKVIVKINPLPTVDFSFTNNNTCSGESLQFTSNATGNGTLSYSWNFGDGNTSTEENPTNVYNVVGNGSQVFSVSLIVSDDNGCNTTIIKDVQVHKIPDISFFSGSGGFANCSDGTSDNFNLELFNSSVSSSEITSYTIDWGNGIETFSGFPTNGSGIMHAYPIGIFTLSITATNVNGCSNLITYDISNGSNPGGALESPGSTVGLCLPMDDPLGFYLTILDWGSNPINTSYSVNFGDGNVQNFTQQYLESEEEYNASNPDASIGYKVYHSYTKGSCLESSEEFIATLTIANDCGDTKFTVDSINVLEPSEPLFDVSSNIECINTPIEFENQTLIGDGVNCNKTARFTWDFGDGTFINTPFGSTADNQTHTYTATGNYTVILSVAGDCGTYTYQEDICIEPEMIASYDLDTQEGCIPLAVSTQNTIDESELCSDPDYTWTVSYTDANCGSVEDWEFTDGTAASSENPQFLFNNPGAYTLTQNIITNCGTFSTQKVINVKKPPTAAINPIANLCQHAVLTPVAVVENCTDDLGVTYSWTFSGGTPATSTLQNPENISYGTTGTFTVTLEVTNECGVSNTATQQFEVLEKPIITNSPTTQEICSNQSTTPISLTASNTNSSFLWTATTVPNNPNITGFTSSGTSQVIPSQTIVNNGTTSGNIVYTVTPDLNGCLGDPIEVLTVIVNPTPIITTQPVGSEVCLNGNATLLEVDYAYGTGAPAYQWFSNTNNINSGGTLITGATNTSYNPPTNTVGEIFYYAEISFSSGACSQIVSNTASVNVVPQITINAFAPQQTICVGGTADQLEITFSGGTGNPTYQWFSNTSNTNTGGTLIATATNNSYTPPVFTNAGNFYFYVEISLDGDGCSFALSDVFEVNVLADPIINTQPITSQELCQNAVPTDLAVVVSGGTTSNKIYQWYLNTTNSNAGGIPITGETLGTYSPSTDTEGTFYYYAVITQPESGCAVISDVSVLKINLAPTFTTQPTPSEICLNGNATLLEVDYANGTGAPAYQWFSNTNNINSGGTLITGATNTSYNPPTNTVGETFYYAEISFSSGACSQIVSNTASVNVVPQITINAFAPQQTICVGGTADQLEVTFSGGTGNPTYQWFSNTSNTNTGGTLIATATNNSYTPPVFTNAGNFYFYVEISLDGDGCSFALSDVFEVNVLADPIINTQPITSQELCQNAVPTDLAVVVSGGTTSNKIYQWYLNTTNSNAGGITITGETLGTYSPSTDTVGTFYYYAVITQPESGCAVTSDVSVLKINVAPTFTTQPTPSEICLNGTANTLEVLTENGVGTPTYQWFSNTTNSSAGATEITGATNSTYNPPTNTVGEVFYFVVISFDGGCSDIQSTITLVNTIAEPIATAVDPEQTICLNGQADTFEITLTGGVGNPTYQWFSNTTNTNSGGTAIAGATNSTYDTGVLSSISAFYYYLEVTLDGTGCDLATSDVFTVNVVADPVIGTQAIASQEVCQNTILEALEVVVSGNTNTGDFSYQWFSNSTNANTGGALITGATTNVYNPDNSTVGTFFYYVVINQATSGCEVISEVSTIILNEGPTITTQPVSSDICLDGVANVLEVLTENGVGTPTYQWFSNTTNSSAGATEITGATNSTYNPPTNTVGEVFYFVVISFDGGCSDIQSTIALVNVNQVPVIDFAQITIYSEETFLFDPSLVASNIVPTGTTYTWTAPTSSTPGAILGSSAEISPQTNISQTLENTDIFPVIETYIITPATTNCAGNPFTLEVTVNPKIIPNVLVTNNTCFESNDGIITTNITGGVPFTTGTSYLISWTGPNSFTSTASSISNLIAGIYILRIEDSNGVFITEQYTVTQPDLLIITTDLEQNISCFEGSDGAIEVSASGGTLSYTFNWTTTDGTGIVQGNEDQSGLTTGTYNLELMDKNACLTTKTFILTEPKAIGISTVLKEDILCFGDAAGAIEIAVTGGTPIEVSSGVFEYTYSWLGPNGFTSNVQNISNLFAGTYTIEITDNLGCIERTDIVLTEPTAIEINYTKIDVTCYGATDGAIDVTVTGGRPPYQISWSNFGNGYSQSNLSAGDYIVTITDENQCEANVTITIEQPIFFIAPIVNPISCNNANDASIDLNLTGGVAPITVSWSDDPSAGVQRNNLAPGSYTVTILDSELNQCPIIQTFIITNPPAITVTNVVTDAIDCTIENSGSILLEVSGGTPPYDFIWNTGQTTEDLTNIPPGDYSVEIKDKNNCIINKQFSIYRQEPIEIEFLVTEIPDCDLKTVSQRTVAKITGGISPYTYSWSAGSVSITDNTIMTTSQNGLYTLTITDDKGCTESKMFLVDLPTIGNADYSYDAFSINNYNLLSIADPIQFTNLTIGNYSNITWDFGDGSPTTSDENPVHIYDQVGVFNVVLKIELDFGCIAIIEKTLNITQGYVLINPNAFSPNNDGYNETIRPSFKGFKEIEMTIYDTWGVPIYYEKNLELNGWDGTIKGLPAENGNYVMVVKGNTFYEKEIITITALTLLK